jgi:hypothetical protein
MREFKELESLYSLIVAIVEEGSLLVDFPVCRLSDEGILVFLVVRHLVWSNEFLGFFEGSLRPRAGVQVVRSLAFAFADQVVDDT